MATSTRPQTATPTRTPGAVGSRPREPRTIARTRPQVTRARPPTVPLPRGDGDSSQGLAVRRPLAEAVEADGNREQQALVVRRAWAAAVAGAFTDEPSGAARQRQLCETVLVRCLTGGVLEDSHVASTQQNACYDPMGPSDVDHFPCRLQQVPSTYA